MGEGVCIYLFLMLFLEPLKTLDRFLLGQIGCLGCRGRLVASFRLFSRAPGRGTFEVFLVEALLFRVGFGLVFRFGGGGLQFMKSATRVKHREMSRYDGLFHSDTQTGLLRHLG